MGMPWSKKMQKEKENSWKRIKIYKYNDSIVSKINYKEIWFLSSLALCPLLPQANGRVVEDMSCTYLPIYNNYL